MTLKITTPIFLLTLLLSSCDALDVQGVDEFVVEAYLIEGQQLPIVRLSRTTGIDEQYDFTALAVTNASARIELLATDGSVETAIPYSQRENLYWPDENHFVQAARTYRLTIDIPGVDQQIVATTLIPGAFDLISGKPDSVLYQGAEQFSVNVTESVYPGRQAVYVFTVEALEPSVESLTPFYRDVLNPDSEDGGEIEDVILNESFVINEANFDIEPDGTFSIKLPWLAVAFYGPNNIIVNAIDDNLFDFLRSHTVQQGGSTFSPGEIPNVIDNIEGATGVFGAITRRNSEVFIKDREL